MKRRRKLLGYRVKDGSLYVEMRWSPLFGGERMLALLKPCGPPVRRWRAKDLLEWWEETGHTGRIVRIYAKRR